MAIPLNAVSQFFDNDGDPLSGGKVWTYEAGTLTPLATYTSQDGDVLNTNPVVLDAAGRAQIWLAPNVPYKIRVTDASDVELEVTDEFYAGMNPEQLEVAGQVPAAGGAFTGEVNFEGGATFDGTPAQDLATLDSLNIASVQNANLWTNPDGIIWQRATASVADGAYGFDRVVNLCESGNTTLSQLGQPVDGIPFAMRMTQPDASPKRMGMCQIVEAKACLAYRGEQLVFAPKVRCSAAVTVRAALVAWVGTLDSPTRDVVNNWSSTTYTASNFFVANTLPIAVGAVALSPSTWADVAVSSVSPGGVVAPSTMNNLYLLLWTDTAVAQNVTLDTSLMRAGRGTNIPLWTPPDPREELAKCQGFFETGLSSFALYAAASAILRLRIKFLVTKRIPPSVATSGIVESNASGSGVTTPTVDSVEHAWTVTATGVSGSTFSWAASADL